MFKLVAATVSLVLPSLLVHASPLTPTTELTTIASTFPVHTLEGEFSHPNITISKYSLSARSLAARQEFPAALLLCDDFSCLACVPYDLVTIPEDECFAPMLFNSAGIDQPSGQGLPFAVAVGPAGCASFLTIPVVNKCFAINNGPFQSIALVS